MITLLSKATVNSVITVIRDKISQWISEVTDMFSVEIDTTQDISTQDQCSAVVRCVDSSGGIQERLVSVVKCDESSGEAFVQLVCEVTSTLKLDLRNRVGNSADGATNMQGRYKGFSTLLSKVTSNHIHVWCHAHVLNLVVTEAKSVVVTSSSLFSLLNHRRILSRISSTNELVDSALFYCKTNRKDRRYQMVVKGCPLKKGFGFIQQSKWSTF